MLNLNATSSFKKDLKLCHKRGYDLDKLNAVIDLLRIPEPLPDKYRDHALKGPWVPHRECHILPDWLLIYRQTDTDLYLARTGTHSDLLNL